MSSFECTRGWLEKTYEPVEAGPVFQREHLTACCAGSLSRVTPLVLCAVDLGPTSPRVLLHAAGFAAVLGAALKVVHIASETDPETQRRVAAECLRMAPYQAMFEESDVLVRVGPVAKPFTRKRCSTTPRSWSSAAAATRAS